MRMSITCLQSSFPGMQVDVEHDGSEGESGLEELALSIRVVATQNRHFSRASLFGRKAVDVLNVMDLRKKLSWSKTQTLNL